MQTKKQNRTLAVALSFLTMAIFNFLPVPAGLTPAGMQVFGVFFGTLLLWLTVGIDWPSLLCILALALVPGLKMGTVLSGSIGNVTFSFLMFTFMCTYALGQTPFVRRCAGWFIASRLAKRGPWAFTVLFFASVLFLGAFISPTVLFVIYLPILEEICALLKLEKGGKTGAMLMLGLVFCCGISSGMTPIAHVFPIMAMEYFKTATGGAISYAAYMAFGIPTAIVAFVAMLLLFRYVLKPDMAFDAAAGGLAAKQAPMAKREKATLAIFAGVVALWVLPGLLAGILPFAAKVDALGTAFPPLLGAVLLCIIQIDGAPLLNFAKAMGEGIPWASLIMCAATLAVGSAVTNTDIGITAWVSGVMQPLTQNMAPLVLVLFFAFWATVQTNLSSNMVTVTVVTAVAVPVCAAAAGVNTAAVCCVIGFLASCAFATPPAMPCVAIAGASGWVSGGQLLRYGIFMGLVCALAAGGLGYFIAAACMV